MGLSSNIETWFPHTTAPFVANAPMFGFADYRLAVAVTKAKGLGSSPSPVVFVREQGDCFIGINFILTASNNYRIYRWRLRLPIRSNPASTVRRPARESPTRTWGNTSLKTAADRRGVYHI